MLLLVWAAIEELVKFSAISLVALRSVYFDEPVDALIYMITVALGFAAIENSLFLLAPLLDGDLTGSLLTGNLRYMGATLCTRPLQALSVSHSAFHFTKADSRAC